jgi:uncharacterized protein (TIGR02231 family)
MKNILIFAFSLFLANSAFAGKKLVDSKIKGITVYPVGAMVSREGVVKIPAGNNQIVLDNLTHAIDPNTIQVGGTGSFDILSVKFELFYPYAKTKPEGIKIIEDSLKIFRDQRFILEAEDKALNDERNMIIANQKIAGGNSTITVAQLDAMAKYYRKRLANISSEKLRNQNERIIIIAQEKRLNATLAGMNQYKYEQVGRIVVETNSKIATTARFQFSYFTHLAGWFPTYNIKAISDDANINVDYHAYVTQSTGVDWNNIDLILSTSRPTYNNQKPEISPWYLDYQTAMKSRSQAATLYGEQNGEMSANDSYGNTVYENGQYKDLDASKSAGFVSGQALLNALNTSYKINSKYSVMSNNSRKQVFIKSIKIPAEFNYYSVPSMEKESFLTASITDWGQYDLIPGNATLFYNNTYIGKSYVFSNTAEDTLQISFGRDKGLVLTQEKVRDQCVTKKIGNNVKKDFVYEITAKNNKREEITIVIYDRVPVSKRNDIVVTNGDLAGAELDKETGILKWTKTIPAGQKVTIRFDYEVKYPKEKSKKPKFY